MSRELVVAIHVTQQRRFASRAA